MEKVNIESTPEVRTPIFVVALPGVGNIGLIALGLLLKFSDGKRFAHYHSKNFPDYVIVEETGICRLPGFDFYASKSVEPNLVLAMSDTPIISEEPKNYYDVLDEVVRFALELNSTIMVAVDGVAAVDGEGDSIHVVATAKELVADFEKFGAHSCEAPRLPGSVGLLVGLSQRHGLRGVGLLGNTASSVPDGEAGQRMYDFLVRTFHITKANVMI